MGKTTTAMAELASSMSHNEAEEETQNNLFALTKDNQQRIDQLEKEKEQMKSLVDELKYSAAGGAARRQIGEDLESHLNEAQAKCDRNRGKFERIAKVLIDVKAGVDHIGANLQPIKLDGEAPMEISDETVEEVLSQCELKLSKLISMTNMDTQTKKAKQQAGEYQEKMLAKSQSDIRIRLGDQDQDGDDDDDDDFEDDIDEDVWNRKHVKYNSEQIMEKQQKKHRKKASKKAKP